MRYNWAAVQPHMISHMAGNGAHMGMLMTSRVKVLERRRVLHEQRCAQLHPSGAQMVSCQRLDLDINLTKSLAAPLLLLHLLTVPCMASCWWS